MLRCLVSMRLGMPSGMRNVYVDDAAGAVAPDAEAGNAGELGDAAQLEQIRAELEEVDALEDGR